MTDALRLWHEPHLRICAFSLAAIVTLCLGVMPGAAAFAAGTPAASPTASPAASPAASPIAGGVDRGGTSAAGEAIAAVTSRIVGDNPILSRIMGPTAGDALFDPFGIFTEGETGSLAGDARRLTAAGLPTLVYARISMANPAQSRVFATTLVQKRGLVESSPGAQDGLVVLLSVWPGAPEKSTVVIAHGANALPVHGLNDASIQRIVADGVVPRLQKGNLFSAVQYGLREFNYVVAYTPYSTPVLSGTARTVGQWLGTIAPLAALAGVALLMLTWFGPGATWRVAAGSGWRRWLTLWWPTVIAGGLCAVLVVLGVYARSRIGILGAAILIVAVLLDIRVTADPSIPAQGRRVLRVRPTWPTRLAARREIARQHRTRRRGDTA